MIRLLFRLACGPRFLMILSVQLLLTTRYLSQCFSIRVRGTLMCQDIFFPNVFYLLQTESSAIAQAVSHWLPNAAARVRAWVSSCEICGGESGSGASFSEYFGFPCQSSFHQLLHNHHYLSSGAGKIGHYWPNVDLYIHSPIRLHGVMLN
jgi:hypothetical protein